MRYRRVLRGGSRNNEATRLRPASRVRDLPGVRYNHYGFRVAQD